MKYDELYSDGQLYDLIHTGFTTDINFHVEEAVKSGGPVLEIACGTGRITLPIARKGIEVTGLDIEKGMLNEAKKKAKSENLNIEWIENDCRNFELNKKFNLIFIGFNSIQHLLDLQSLEAFFERVKKHLAKDGLFVFDGFNPSLQILSRKPGERFLVRNYIDPKNGEKTIIEESTSYDVAKQVNRTKWYFSTDQRKNYRVDDLHIRCYYPEEINALVKYNGFTIENKYGDFSRNEFSGASPKQIFRLRVR